jgi:hypothetical protein
VGPAFTYARRVTYVPLLFQRPRHQLRFKRRRAGDPSVEVDELGLTAFASLLVQFGYSRELKATERSGDGALAGTPESNLFWRRRQWVVKILGHAAMRPCVPSCASGLIAPPEPPLRRVHRCPSPLRCDLKPSQPLVFVNTPRCAAYLLNIGIVDKAVHCIIDQPACEALELWVTQETMNAPFVEECNSRLQRRLARKNMPRITRR